MWRHEGAEPPTVSASHASDFCDISDEFLTAWLLTSWTVMWNKWRHKEETQGSGLGEVGCWGVKLSGCKIALQTCSSFSICCWALNTLIHLPIWPPLFLRFLFFEGLPSLYNHDDNLACLVFMVVWLWFCYQSNKRSSFLLLFGGEVQKVQPSNIQTLICPKTA